MEDFLKYLKEMKKEIINPMELTFEDIGFEDPNDLPKDKTVEDFIEELEELNEYQQGQLSIIEEIIQYIKTTNKEE